MTIVIRILYRESRQENLDQKAMDAVNQISKILEIIQSNAKTSRRGKVSAMLLRMFLVNQPDLTNFFGLKKPSTPKNRFVPTFLWH